MRSIILAGAAALALAACAQRPEPAGVGSVARASATVVSVDMATRSVRLRDRNGGGTFSVVAGPEVRNLAELAPGDTVLVDVFEATLVDLADPTDPGLPQTDLLAGRAPEGAKPGGGVLTATSFVVELVIYDKSTGVATFTLPDGTQRSAPVRPQLRAFAEARKPGDRVVVTLVEGMAISIAEVEA